MPKKIANQTPTHWGKKYGPEKLDPVPVEIPAGYEMPLSLNDMMRQMLTDELEKRNPEEETYEEFHDFSEEGIELDGDQFDESPYQFDEMEEEWPTLPPEDPESTETQPEATGDDMAESQGAAAETESPAAAAPQDALGDQDDR